MITEAPATEVQTILERGEASLSNALMLSTTAAWFTISPSTMVSSGRVTLEKERTTQPPLFFSTSTSFIALEPISRPTIGLLPNPNMGSPP